MWPTRSVAVSSSRYTTTEALDTSVQNMERSRSAFQEPPPQTLGMPAQRTDTMPRAERGPAAYTDVGPAARTDAGPNVRSDGGPNVPAWKDCSHLQATWQSEASLAGAQRCVEAYKARQRLRERLPEAAAGVNDAEASAVTTEAQTTFTCAPPYRSRGHLHARLWTDVASVEGCQPSTMSHDEGHNEARAPGFGYVAGDVRRDACER